MDGKPEQSMGNAGFASAGQRDTDDTAKAVPRAVARLIEYKLGQCIALPPHTTYALIEHPEPMAVPGAARYAYGLLRWQDMWLPLIDLNALLHGPGPGLTAAPRYALIVAYQRMPRAALEYGAIALEALPQTITVGDHLRCELPSDSDRWPMLALSCFRHQGQAVPILDTTRLFASVHC